jgi:hypothetical protein
MKPLLFGTFIAFTFAITPSWAANEIRTEKHVIIKKHKVARKHKTNKKHTAKITLPAAASMPIVIAQPTAPVVPVAAKDTPEKIAESVQVATPNSKPETAAVSPKAPFITPAEVPATPAPSPIVAVSTPPSKQSNPYLQPSATLPLAVPAMLAPAASAASAASAAHQAIADTVRPVPTSPVKPYLQPSATLPAPAPAASAATPTIEVTVRPLPTPPVNPYLQASATLPAPAASAATPTIAVTVRPLPTPPVNPYLQAMMIRPVIANTPPADFFPPFVVMPSVNSIPGMPKITAVGNAFGAPTFNNLASFTTSLMPSGLPSFFSGDPGASHMPISFSMVYPTGDKPLAVLTLKCPTEAVFGVAPPPVKLVHFLLTSAMDGINYSGLLPFNLQQVCQ